MGAGASSGRQTTILASPLNGNCTKKDSITHGTQTGEFYLECINDDMHAHVTYATGLNALPKPKARCWANKNRQSLNCLIFRLYLRPESNRHARRHTILSRARLPIPPLRHRHIRSFSNGLQICAKFGFPSTPAANYPRIAFSPQTGCAPPSWPPLQ